MEKTATLKENLKSQAPVIIYIKGNKQILKEQSIAIVGSRSASDHALAFTDNIAKLASREYKVLSTFHPKSPWKVELAMARNPIIYGLAREIYVAESNEKGGTWYGVVDGLKKGRKIYVRKPDENEKNANEKLIAMGAIPVDFTGKALESYLPQNSPTTLSLVNEPSVKQPGKRSRPKANQEPKQKGLFDD